jgi:uncharacterized protein (TIGR02597 family)
MLPVPAPRRAFSLAAVASALITGGTISPLAAATVYTPPVGGMSFTITGGSAEAPVTTPIALPLADTPAATGAKRGRIAAINGNVITVTGAGWSENALSNSAFPYQVRIISGSGAGARLGITANTADTLTVTGRDLVELGVVSGDSGDIIELVPVDTLGSLFAGDTFLGGTNAAEADVLTLGESALTHYFYDTANSYWSDAETPAGSTDNAALPPEGFFAVARRGDAFTLRFTGAVQTSPTSIPVANSGTTFTHSGFPVPVTLGELALNTSISGWATSTTAETADLVGIAAGGSWVFYFHNGSTWQRTPGTSTTSRDDVVIRAGTPIQIFRRGDATGTTALVRSVPSAR